MKYAKARMFNRGAARAKSKPNEILKTLALRPGQAIADIGSGGGYFTLRFAEAVGKAGRVFAVDTNPDFLEFIKRQARDRGLDNIQPTLIVGDEVALPECSLDYIFFRNVFHHLPNRLEYLSQLRGALKPQGKFVIIEHEPGGFSWHGIFGHFVAQDKIIEEMHKAGYRVDQKLDILPKQSFTIFFPSSAKPSQSGSASDAPAGPPTV